MMQLSLQLLVMQSVMQLVLEMEKELEMQWVAILSVMQWVVQRDEAIGDVTGCNWCCRDGLGVQIHAESSQIHSGNLENVFRTLFGVFMCEKVCPNLAALQV